LEPLKPEGVGLMLLVVRQQERRAEFRLAHEMKA
jgi:hypothetical protein